jgi:hypothetical protein
MGDLNTRRYSQPFARCLLLAFSRRPPHNIFSLLHKLHHRTMKFSIAAVVALGAAPVFSFSYLESLSSRAPMTSSVDIAPPVPAHPAPSESTDAPFFFTNGAQGQPADSPAFFFTNGASDSTPARTTGSYLDNLGGARAAPAGRATGAASSGASYLDALGSGATSVSGPGMYGYLDALPHNSGSMGGPGISSYAASLNQAAAEYQAATAPPPAQSQPVAPVAPAQPSASVGGSAAPTSGSYLEALSSGSSIGGPGIASYLDALPRSAALAGGVGISTYVSNIVSSNVAGGPGLTSYTDALSGPSSFAKSYAPSRGFSPASGAAASFAIGSTTGRFDFTLEADAETIELLKANAGRRVTLTGRITSW